MVRKKQHKMKKFNDGKDPALLKDLLSGPLVYPFVSEKQFNYQGMWSYGVESKDTKWFYGHFFGNHPQVDNEHRKTLSEEFAPEYLRGEWVYLGLALGHFGHLAQDLFPRLYLALLSSESSGLLVIPHKPGMEEFLRVQIGRVLKLWGMPPKKIYFVYKPTYVESLWVGEPGMSRNKMNPTAGIFISNSLAITPPLGSPTKIVVSRRGFDMQGRLAGFDSVIADLSLNGWFEFQPQLYTLSRQVELLIGAQQVLWEEGSALYLASLAGRLKGQRHYLVKRRGHHDLDQLLPSLDATFESSLPPQLMELPGKGMNSALGFYERPHAVEFIKKIETFTGARLQINKFLEAQSATLRAGQIMGKLAESGLKWSDIQKAWNVQGSNANLGNQKWQMTRKPVDASVIGWAVDKPNRGQGEFTTPAFEDIVIQGWVLATESVEVFVEADSVEVAGVFNIKREAVADMYREKGHTVNSDFCGFTITVPGEWESFSLRIRIGKQLVDLMNFSKTR